MSGDILDLSIDTRRRQSETLNLVIPASSAKASLLYPDAELHHAGRAYKVTELEDLRQGERTLIAVEAEATWYELGEDAQPGTVVITAATPADGLAAILDASSTAWTAGGASTADAATFNLEESDRTTLELLRIWENITGKFVRFDTVARTVDITDSEGVDRGIGFRYRRNVTGVRRRELAPPVTVLYPYGADDLTIAGVNAGAPYLESFDYYTDQGIPLATARQRFTRSAIWVDTSYVTDTELLAAATAELAERSQPIVTYELDVIDLRDFTNIAADDLIDGLTVGDTVRVYDPTFGRNIRTTVVRTLIHPLEPHRNAVELAYLPSNLNDVNTSSSRSDRGEQWVLFTGPVRGTYQIRNDGTYTVARIPLRFTAAGGRLHAHLDLDLVGVGAGTAHVSIYDTEAAAEVFRPIDLDYTDGETVTARRTFAVDPQAGRVDYRIRVTTTATGGPHPSAGVNITADDVDNGEASFYVLAQNAVRETPTADNSARYEFTGAIQTFTVPDNVTEVTIEAAGARGGTDNAAARKPGYGTIVTATYQVIPGTVYDVLVGGIGAAGNTSGGLGGWPNGGDGGDAGDQEGGGGGGSSDVRPTGGSYLDALLIAPAGGGAPDLNLSTARAGGDAGFYAGEDGEDGGAALGGDGATQFAGGAGGTGPGAAGTAGSAFQGGTGGNAGTFDDPGGGGGGGRFGGGGASGGTPSTSAGGGGGGSGYIDPDAYDIEIADGANNAAGYVEFRWSDPV